MTTTKRSPLLILFLTVFLDLLGFGLIIPSLGVYAKALAQEQSLTAPIFAATSLGFIYSLMQFFCMPLWGRLSDRIGRRPVLLISIIGSAIGFLGVGLAQSFWMLLLARAFAGVMTSNLSVAQAYIADVTPPDKRSRSMGLIGVAFGLGFILGPFIGGELSGAYGTAAPSFFAAGLAAINFVWALVALPESRKANDVIQRANRFETFKKDIVQSPKLFSLMIVSFLSIFAFANLEQTFGLMLQDKFAIQNEAEAGQLTGRYLGFVGVIGAFLQGGLLGRLVKKFQEPRLIIFGLFATAVGMALLTSLDGRTLLLLPLFIIAVGQGIYTPSTSGLLSRLSDPNRQGEILGVAQSANALGRILGPAWGGMVFQNYGYHAPYISGALVLVLAVFLALRSRSLWSQG